MTKDEGKARSAFSLRAHSREKVMETQPNNSKELGLLGLIDAYIGRKKEALREGRRAVSCSCGKRCNGGNRSLTIGDDGCRSQRQSISLLKN